MAGEWVEVEPGKFLGPWQPVQSGALKGPALPYKEAGQKNDQNKSRVDLLDTEWLEGVGDVLKFGAKKYAAHNWRNGIGIHRLLGAALRHVFATLRGENLDPESGLHHLLHASCCLMFAYWTLTHKPELDDRWKQ